MISEIGSGAYMYPWQMVSMQRHRGNLFEKLDSNGDGVLDKTELGSFAEKISEMTGQSADVDQILAKLDADEDGLVSQEEFEAGRPQGPPPGMMGMMHGMQGSGIESLLNILSSSKNEDFAVSVDSFDKNGDGMVDAEEAKAGFNYFIQEYLNQMIIASGEDTKNGGLLDQQG